MSRLSETALPPGLGELLALRDPIGVLTVYADADAGAGSRHRPTAEELAVRSRLRALSARAHAEGPSDRARLLDERLDELAGRLSEALEPTGPGGGRAFLVTLSDGRVRELGVSCGMGEDAALEQSALLMPLVAALADEQPVGVVALTADGVHAVEVRGAAVAEVLREDYAIPVEDWRPLLGPAAAGSGQRRESVAQRDLFARRLDEHRRRRVAEIAGRLWPEARRRGWTGLLASGPGDLVDALAAGRPPDGPELVVAEHRLPDALLADDARRAAAGPIATARAAAERELAAGVRDAALSATGRAAVGVDDVLTALAEGRVQHLVLDPGRRHAGTRAADGRLAAAGEVLPGAGGAAPEPHLMERMLERALATGAGVTVLHDAATGPVADHGGVGAALRW
jgi:hypothetical protein